MTIGDIDLHFPSMVRVRPNHQEVVHGHRVEGSSRHSRDTDYSRECLAARVGSARTVAAQEVAHKSHLVGKVAADEKHRRRCGQESHRNLADHPRPSSRSGAPPRGEGWFEASLRVASVIVVRP